MSSKNIYISGDLISKSLIIKTNNHGPSLVPRGTPEGTGPHSEKQPFVTFFCLWVGVFQLNYC